MVDGEPLGIAESLHPALNQILPVHITRSAVSVDLSGAAVTVVALHSERACVLKKATLLYTEASSVDAGIALKIGKESDDDYFYTGTSEISKSQWYTKDVTLLQTSLSAGDTVLFYSAGAKAGTGEVMLILEYYYYTAV